MLWINLLLGLLALVIASGVAILGLIYWRSPQRQWRDRVLGIVAATRRRLAEERQLLNDLTRSQETEQQATTQRAMQQALSAVPVEALEGCPGIGPATAAKLRAAGYGNLAILQHAQIRISGLGEKRLTDIEHAVASLTQPALQRFRSAGSPEAKALNARLRNVAEHFALRQSLARIRLQCAQNVLARLENAAECAHSINLWTYWWRDSDTLVPPDLHKAAMPDLDAELRSAEQQARAVSVEAMPVAVVAKAIPVPTIPAAPAAPVHSAPASRRGSRLAREIAAADELVIGPRAEVTMAAGRAAHASASALAAASEVAPEDRFVRLMELSIPFAFAIARADGIVSARERQVIDRNVSQQFGVDPARLNRARAFCAQYETAAIDLDDLLHRAAERLSNLERLELLQLAAEIVAVSGSGNRAEAALLETVSRQWKIALPAIPASESPAPVVSATESVVVDPRTVLEIDPGVPITADLVRRQFHHLSERYVPERLATLGPEFVGMADQKRQALHKAAENLLKPLGEPLNLPAPPKAAPAGMRENPDLDAFFGA